MPSTRRPYLFSMVLVAAVAGLVTASPESYTNNPWTAGEDLSGRSVSIFGPFLYSDADNFEASMVPFEKQTGIDIEYDGSGDFGALIPIRTGAGSPPDIAVFRYPDVMHAMVQRGHILDVRDIVSEAKLSTNYDESWRDMARYGGIEAGVWYRASLKSLVWYPYPEFSEAGYEVPETWDEMLALSDQMVSDGETPWSIAMESSGATGWVATDWMEDIMLRTVAPGVYDLWTEGLLPFDSEPVRRAANILAEIWFNSDYVLGGTNSILTVPFGDGVAPMEENPPRAWLHRQASFIVGFFSEGISVGEDMRYFYLPPIDEEQGTPVLISGAIMSPMTNTPETAAAMRYLSEGLSTKAWVETGAMVSPHNDTELSWYPDEWSRGYAEILHNGTAVRFDGSDVMPGQVGTGSFWTGMTNWVRGASLEGVLEEIDQSWPSPSPVAREVRTVPEMAEFAHAVVTENMGEAARAARMMESESVASHALRFLLRRTMNTAIAEALLAQGADPDSRDQNGVTALMLAAQKCSEDEVSGGTLSALLDESAHIDARDVQGRTALMHAAEHEAPAACLRLFMEHGARVKAEDGEGNTPLLIALENGANPASLGVLVEAGADPQARNAQGRTPVMIAARGGSRETVSLLLRHGADPDSVDAEGKSALYFAAAHSSDQRVLERLLKAMDDPLDTGISPLVGASRHNSNSGILEALLNMGFREHLNVRGDNGMTPLMHAAQSNSPEIVRLLLEAGSDATVVDTAGRTAFDFAANNTQVRGTEVYWRLNDLLYE